MGDIESMHIGYLAPTWPPERTTNGITTYLGHVQKGLQARGHKVTVFSVGSIGGPESAKAVSRTMHGRILGRLDHSLGSQMLFSKKVAMAVLREHASSPLDILEVEDSFGRAAHLAKALPMPVVTRLHGPHFLVRQLQAGERFSLKDQVRVYLEGRAVTVSAGVTCPSAEVLRLVLARYGISPRSARVIPNPMPMASDRLRWSLEKSDPNLIGYVGRFDYPKGADLIIDAFTILALRMPKLRLAFAGPDAGIRDPVGRILKFHEYLAMKVPETVRSRIDYLGIQSKAELAELRQRARVFAVASRFETSCYAIAESLSAGAPIVSTATIGALDLLETGENGLCTPLGDVGALAAAIEAVVANPNLATRFSQRGRQICSERLSVANVCNLTEEYYSTLAQRYAYSNHSKRA